MEREEKAERGEVKEEGEVERSTEQLVVAILSHTTISRCHSGRREVRVKVGGSFAVWSTMKMSLSCRAMVPSCSTVKGE